jgi:hypothetical protein
VTTSERIVLEYYAGLARPPLRFRPRANVYEAWSAQPRIELDVDEEVVVACELAGWVTPVRYCGPLGAPSRAVTAIGVLALGQL